MGATQGAKGGRSVEMNAALEQLIDQLRAKGVRSFKGQLLNPDGSKLWDLDIVFERPTPARPEREE
jgi:hypothetical protein